MRRKYFTDESEAARKSLFEQIRMAGLDTQYRYGSFSGVMPLSLPDGLRILDLPDSHAPAHHKRIYRAIFDFSKWFRPHLTIFRGDASDMFAFSRWPSPPLAVIDPQNEIDETRELFYDIIASGSMWVLEVLGNHEDRVIRSLFDNRGYARIINPQTREQLFSLQSLLGFTKDDPITFVSGMDERGGFEGGLWINDHIKYEHGKYVRPIGGHGAMTHVDKHGRSTAIGHTHGMGQVALPQHGNRVMVASEGACLIDFQHAYFGYAPMQNWHHGFNVGHVYGGKLHLEPIPVYQSQNEKGGKSYYFTYANEVFVSGDR